MTSQQSTRHRFSDLENELQSEIWQWHPPTSCSSWHNEINQHGYLLSHVAQSCYSVTGNNCKQDAQLSQRNCAAQGALVLAQSGRLEMGDNILWTL